MARITKKEIKKKIKIGVNVRIYDKKPSGIQNFIHGLFSELIKNYPQFQFVFFSIGKKKITENAIHITPGSYFEKLLKNVHPHIKNIFFDNVYILKLMRSENLDVLVAPSYILPLLKPRRMKYITVIHDLSYLTYKHNPFNLYMNYVMYMKLVMPFVLKRADYVVTPSSYVKAQIKKTYGTPDSKITVISEGKDDFFYPEKDVKKFQNLKQKFSIADSYCFTNATNHERKNIFGLIQAFKKINKLPQQQLIMTGLLPEETIHQIKNYIRELDLEEKVKYLGFVSKDDLRSLYSFAKLFIFPSFEEGFGLPILECVSCGCLPICSNTGSLPEIIGNKKLLFNPRDIKSITDKINESLAFSKSERNSEFVKVEKHINQYTWQTTAAEFAKIFQS